jgi:Peptidase S24-like
MNKYSQTFADAMERTGIRNTVVAAHVGKIGYNNIAQWRTGRRPIPAEHAPKVAALLGVPPESISESYDRLMQSGAILPDAAGPGTRSSPPARHVIISQLEGFGRAEEPDRIWLPESVVKRKLGLIAVENVRWAVQLSWAMEPEIERHALVLVDITADRHEEVLDGGLYVYSLWGRPDIRRVAIRRDTWELIGSNQEVERITVGEGELSHLHLFGAVVGWL